MGPQPDRDPEERCSDAQRARHRTEAGRNGETVGNGRGRQNDNRDGSRVTQRLRDDARYTGNDGVGNGGDPTGLGISRPNIRSRSFLSLGDDDDDDERFGLPAWCRTGLVHNSDRVPRTDFELSLLVDAFPCPPAPDTRASFAPPLSTGSSDSHQHREIRQLHHDLSAVPRANAAASRRMRPCASPVSVSVYFSPDRPPALPLPSLPVVGTSPLKLAVPAQRPRTEADRPSDPTGASRSIVSSHAAAIATAPLPQSAEKLAFHARTSRRSQPPTAPPPDRPLPSLPSPALAIQKNSRPLSYPETRGSPDLPVPPPSANFSTTPARSPKPEASFSALESERTHACSIDSDCSTRTAKPPDLTQLHPLAADLDASDQYFGQARTRVDSTTSVASLDVAQISLQLSRLASKGNDMATSTTTMAAPTLSDAGTIAPETERDQDRERVRRLISRVSSVIEKRKMSTASTTRTTSDSNGGATPLRGKRSGYKAYKLTAMSRSNSSSTLSDGKSPFTRASHSRTPSRDSESGSSASEEIFDLSFDSLLLSPANAVATGGEEENGRFLSSSRWEESPRASYVRRSQIPPRWAGRRRSSATTVDGEETVADNRSERTASERGETPSSQDATDQLRGEALEEDLEAEEGRPPRRNLRPVTSHDSLRSSTTRTLRPVNSVPGLRDSARNGTPNHPPSPYSPSFVGLKPLATSIHSRALTSQSLSASSTSTETEITWSGFSKSSSVQSRPESSVPFTLSPSASPTSQSSVATFRKSSLPCPSSRSRSSPPGLRRPTASASLVRFADPDRPRHHSPSQRHR